MSRKSIALPPRAQPKPARAAASPTQEALRRLADMIGRGFDGARMEREVAALLTDWSGTLDMDDLRERLDEMRDQLADGIEAAEEQAAEVEDKKADGLATRRTMQALRATHSALSQASSVF